MIQITQCEPREIILTTSEILRYLGYCHNTADADTLSTIEGCLAEICHSFKPKACFDFFDITRKPGGTLVTGFMSSRSKSLRKNLAGCEKVILFAATLGIDIDRILSKFSITSLHDAIIVQAIGAAAIEKWCDILCHTFGKTANEQGYFLRPRFSPGYGDFPLEIQKNIFDVLDCSRKIGLTLTDSLLMMPSKSVTAIIGLSRENTNCSPRGCEVCDKTDCNFRR